MYGFEPLGGILWIIFLVIIVGVIIRLIRGSGYHGMYHRGWREEKDEAVDILKAVSYTHLTLPTKRIV